MTRTDKLLVSMARNPQGDWTIEDVRTVCDAFGLRFRRGAGSHATVSHPAKADILTIPAHRPIKPVYIRKLVRFVAATQGSDDDGT